ncbi:Membrane-spanning 4-domains subfamily A member 8A-like [Arapaima gigas]
MSMSVTKGDGVTVVTVKSDSHSSCPLMCQLLGVLCYSPVCTVSQQLRRLLGGTLSMLATIQIMGGLFNICLGATLSANSWTILQVTAAPYWLGGILIALGFVSILAERFPSPCLACLSALASMCSCAFAITAIVLYSVDLADGQGLQSYCQWQMQRSTWYSNYESNRNSYRDNWQSSVSPDMISMKAQLQEELNLCKNEKYMVMMTLGAIEILLIIVATVQLCVGITSFILTTKALCRNYTEAKKDPELRKHLLWEDFARAV